MLIATVVRHVFSLFGDVPAIVALATIICWTLVMAPKSVTFQRHDHMVSAVDLILVHMHMSQVVKLGLNC